MSDDTAIFVGASDADQFLLLKYANRHGLIAGATGTGKTVTLQTIAEGFSAYGVPVFMADVKGDLSGIARPGGDNPRAVERAGQLGIENYSGRAFPTIFWDLFGERGHPVRTTVTEIGPVLMARLLQLNATQEGVLNIVFKVADEQGLLLLDFKDLQSVLQWTAENAGSLTTRYGNVSKQTVGTIQRALLTLEQQGGERFFGEPALDLKDMIGRDPTGAGYVNILAADRLMQSPRLYATFLLWLLSELFEIMPEVGDVDRPKFVFFFDEAHLLFDDAPKALVDKIEQVVRLIRSKGVGVYFITQNPLDVPESVLGQLGNRVQHALRAFTPRDQKAVKTAAETFRPNKKFNAAEVIQELGVGEALISFLDTKGVPEPVERCLVAPPRARIGPASAAERAAVVKASPLAGKYERVVDRESAYEVLTGRATAGQVEHEDVEHEDPASAARPGRRGQYDAPPPSTPLPPASEPPSSSGPWGTRIPQSQPTEPAEPPRPRPRPRLRDTDRDPEVPPPAPSRTPARRTDSIGTTIAKTATRTVTNVLVREATRAVLKNGGSILRGVLGSLVK
ncbi:helicase HerA-like domain-containing protein [Reyranella sp.]|uniref:helicase HerA-like domain-containing protein n=1 Tax=Reyranella sp. TaxID=1929291 RepID=UPI003784E6A9